MSAAALSPDGSRVLIAGDDGLARFWAVATEPVPDDVEGIKLWVEVLTGMELDADEAVRVLDRQTWHERRRQLAARWSEFETNEGPIAAPTGSRMSGYPRDDGDFGSLDHGHR